MTAKRTIDEIRKADAATVGEVHGEPQPKVTAFTRDETPWQIALDRHVLLAEIKRLQPYYDDWGRFVDALHSVLTATGLEDAKRIVKETVAGDTVESPPATSESQRAKVGSSEVDPSGERLKYIPCCLVFKGKDCGYTGPVQTCNKTYENCRDLHNLSNCRGWPISEGSQLPPSDLRILMPQERLYTDERLQAAIKLARRTVEPGNTMHPIWDSIFDAEALLAGQRTILSGSREKLTKELTDDLERFSRRKKPTP
jgi:hypothetical protein